MFTEPEEFIATVDDGLMEYVTVDGKPSTEKVTSSLKAFTTLYLTSNEPDLP